MEKVLLAIDGIAPDRKAFEYAVQLCARIKAELKVLQIIRVQKGAGCMNTMRKTAFMAKNFWEGSMVAAAFAEAGEAGTAKELMDLSLENTRKLLHESEEAGVACQLILEEGDPERKIINFVKENHGIVLTVYDAPGEEGHGSPKRNGVLRALRKMLPVPVVTVKNKE